MRFNYLLFLVLFANTVASQQILLDLESEPGDVVGQGQVYSFTESDGDFYLSKNQSQGIQWINLDFVQNDQLVFSIQFGPRSGRDFVIGPYPNITGLSTAYAQPGLSALIVGNPLCDRIFGEFQLFELELNGTQVTRLAMDFSQHCESIEAPGLNGMIRYFSNGEPFPTPPDTDSDGVPDSYDNCISKANTDQLDSDQDLLGDACDHINTEANVLIDSDEDDYIGEGILRDFSMQDGLFQVTKIANEVTFFNFRNDESSLQIYLAMPFGMPLEVGIYEDVINYTFQEVNEAAMYVNYNSRSCSFTGDFEVFEVLRDAVGEVLKLDFGYSLSCDSQVGSFTGRVKFDDRIRDVIFYSGIE
jgi:hypothetical protein